ncbi:chemotaxis protein CheA [Pseudobdellovibrio exovorus]|uniref:Chemotaxis protein CheA n=1 Tax=Pseudobdellovibrio exovorus JSS TaxID=1184267 RepID=M4V883_9BACT|nr:chemotaxis protein CheA [Pseudobdellovibrio exovorus]AGH95423.1 histidine kinase [Pseudobdellovibrio exovorus JSS]
MDDFEKTLKLGFIDEALQLIEEFETLLLDLEQDASSKETIDGVFRLIHNIKGSSKAVGFDNLGAFCHELETYMLDIKNGTKKTTKATINKLLLSKDIMTKTLMSYKSNLDAVIDLSSEISMFQHKDEEIVDKNEASTKGAEAIASSSVDANADLPVEESTEVIDIKNFQNKKRLHAVVGADESVRVNLKRVDHLINSVGELVVLQAVLREQVLSHSSIHSKLGRVSEDIGKIIKEVQDLSMSLRMVPAKTLIQKLQRICRDTASGLGKDVKFTIHGEDTEIDKTILELISDPLVHLVRNAVDHGIETPPEREEQGKSPQAELLLSISYEGGKLLISVKDNGRGLNRERILQKAKEKGLLKEGVELSTQQIQELIFAPGFSTKQQVTEVSGRGVGMDVVRTSVENLGGQIEISSEAGMGTEFVVRLPLTLAIIDGMVVRVSGQQFVLPLAQVAETFKVESGQIKEGQSHGLFCLRGKDFPVFDAKQMLHHSKNESQQGNIGILSHAGSFSFVVLVDDIVGQQQIVIKQMGYELSHLRGYVGSAILGDGKPALIMDLAELIEQERLGA